VFSPYYALARRRGAGDPEHHCALNVALYGEGGKRWAMTERGRSALRRDAANLAIGPSALAWDGTTLTIRIDETTVPIPSRLRGTVRLHPSSVTSHEVMLDRNGRHRWWPMAPCARVEVELERPALRWAGPGYLDSNWGDEPLERGFTTWDWSRANLRHGTAILYDARRRGGDATSVAIRCDPSGKVEPFAAPRPVGLPTTRWGVARGTRVDTGQTAAVRETLESAPFYARSVLDTHLLGERSPAVHESLSCDRFDAPWVQMMLPFRMPRAWS
jgi:carotenoid 1,2-hydratase